MLWLEILVPVGFDFIQILGEGMIPRGEVGFIFALIGKSLGVINDALFSSMVLMVIVTTMMTPPLLKYAIASTKRA